MKRLIILLVAVTAVLAGPAAGRKSWLPPAPGAASGIRLLQCRYDGALLTDC